MLSTTYPLQQNANLFVLRRQTISGMWTFWWVFVQGVHVHQPMAKLEAFDTFCICVTIVDMNT